MIAIVVVFLYLAAVLFIGIFAFRKGRSTGEDFFLAGRSIGSIVFFLSLFATNMTAFAILGSSEAAFKQGIGIYGMMASASGIVIPLTLFFIGTRLWSLGRRFGHMTQVSYFRDRWDCSAIGTVIFVLTAAMLVPYLIISIIGGGTILESLTGGRLPFAAGGAIVALVVMANVFFGGMRGAVWVNVLQTLLFLSFGLIAFLAIGHDIDFTQTVQKIASSDKLRYALTRDRVPPAVYFSFLLIPLSSIMFPHMSIMCLTAKRVTAFRKTVVLYPLCIMAIWLPCVFLGAIAVGQPQVTAAMAGSSEELTPWLTHSPQAHPKIVQLLRDSKDPHAAAVLAEVERGTTGEDLGAGLAQVADPAVKPEVMRLASGNANGVLLQMVHLHVPAWLAGLLAAGIISAVMGSDCHQILALSTMFTKDIFDYYGGRKRFGEKGTLFVGRGFILLANGVAYVIALGKPDIFELAISWAFSGFASLAPVMIAALFWKRSTKYGALAAVLFVGASIGTVGLLEHHFAPAHLPGADVPIWTVGTQSILYLFGKTGQLRIWGFTPVVPMVLGSVLCVILFSLLTRRPSRATLEKYFPPRVAGATVPA